jgi:hypothetical protein
MASNLRGYTTFADFQREEIRPSMRIGWSTDEIEHSSQTLDFDLDPFEAQLWEAEKAGSDDE